MLPILKLFMILGISKLAECACTLPSDLTGKWYFSIQGSVEAEFVDSDTLNLPYQGETLPLNCIDFVDDMYYLLRSDQVNYQGLNIYVGICLTLEKINSDAYLFIHRTEKNFLAENLRVAVLFSETATKTDLCNDLTNEERYIMIKSGGNFISECPSEILGTYAYSFTHDTCTKAGISGDFCADTTTMEFGDTTSCPDRIGYSRAAKVHCIHHKTVDSKNYLWTYNTDVSTDESYTFRLSCFMYEVSGTSLKMTQNPKNCDEAQTATTPTTAVDLAEVVGGVFSGTLTSCPTTAPPTTTTTTSSTTTGSSTAPPPTTTTVPTTTGNLTGRRKSFKAKIAADNYRHDNQKDDMVIQMIQRVKRSIPAKTDASNNTTMETRFSPFAQTTDNSSDKFHNETNNSISNFSPNTTTETSVDNNSSYEVDVEYVSLTFVSSATTGITTYVQGQILTSSTLQITNVFNYTDYLDSMESLSPNSNYFRINSSSSMSEYIHSDEFSFPITQRHTKSILVDQEHSALTSGFEFRFPASTPTNLISSKRIEMSSETYFGHQIFTTFKIPPISKTLLMSSDLSVSLNATAQMTTVTEEKQFKFTPDSLATNLEKASEQMITTTDWDENLASPDQTANLATQSKYMSADDNVGRRFNTFITAEFIPSSESKSLHASFSSNSRSLEIEPSFTYPNTETMSETNDYITPGGHEIITEHESTPIMAYTQVYTGPISDDLASKYVKLNSEIDSTLTVGVSQSIGDATEYYSYREQQTTSENYYMASTTAFATVSDKQNTGKATEQFTTSAVIATTTIKTKMPSTYLLNNYATPSSDVDGGSKIKTSFSSFIPTQQLFESNINSDASDRRWNGYTTNSETMPISRLYKQTVDISYIRSSKFETTYDVRSSISQLTETQTIEEWSSRYATPYLETRTISKLYLSNEKSIEPTLDLASTDQQTIYAASSDAIRNISTTKPEQYEPTFKSALFSTERLTTTKPSFQTDEKASTIQKASTYQNETNSKTTVAEHIQTTAYSSTKSFITSSSIISTDHLTSFSNLAPTTTVPEKEQNSDEKIYYVIAIAGVSVILVVLVICIMIYIIWRKRKRKREHQPLSRNQSYAVRFKRPKGRHLTWTTRKESDEEKVDKNIPFDHRARNVKLGEGVDRVRSYVDTGYANDFTSNDSGIYLELCNAIRGRDDSYETIIALH